jgi:hypothetical protein
MINGKEVPMMIDSGSDVTTLSEEAWLDVLKEAEATERPPKNVKWGDGFRILKGYASETPLRIEATFTAQIGIPETGKVVETKIFVIRGDHSWEGRPQWLLESFI